MKPHLLIPAILTLFSSLVHADTTAVNEAGRQWPDNRVEIRQVAAPDATPMDLRDVSPLLVPLGGAVLLLLGGLLIWNRRLLRESRERKHVEQQLRDSEEALTETRRLAHIGWW
ncbi:MAG TPA: hypothetical protein VGB35_00905, partial [Gammaproteobacteria bacterium]